MFDLSVQRQDILAPLLIVFGAVGKKISNPLLSHILLRLHDGVLTLTATDLELEISARIPCVSSQSNGEIAVPAKKFVDIIRSLDERAVPSIKVDAAGMLISEGRSLFKVATLPADGFPRTQDEKSEFELSLPTSSFTKLLQTTHFAVSQQDVRVFLNCLLLDMESTGITVVGTDGHRMAIAKLALPLSGQQRVLLPRRAITEVLRLIAPLEEQQIVFSIGKNYFRLVTSQFTFISKLVESRFPVYSKAIPSQQDLSVTLDTELLKRALNRIVILAHEKSRAVLLHVQSGLITLVANNQEKEEAIESIEGVTVGGEIRIGLNANYLLDVLNCLSSPSVQLSFSNPDSSILVTCSSDESYKYIIMPMKL